MLDFAIKLFLYLLPMYVANSSALVFGGKKRLDFGANFYDKRPLFGKNKTIRGTFLGVSAGILTGYVLMLLFKKEIAYFNNYFLLSVLLSVGAIMGDIIASFLKRRLKFEEGKEFLFLDQLDFVLGGMTFGFIVYVPNIFEFLGILVLTFFIHKTSNFLAYKMRLKKVPW